MMVLDYKVVCPLGSKLLPDGQRCQVQAGVVCWRGGCLTLPHWLRDQARYALIRAGLRAAGLAIVAGSRWMQGRSPLRNGVRPSTCPAADSRARPLAFDARPADAFRRSSSAGDCSRKGRPPAAAGFRAPPTGHAGRAAAHHRPRPPPTPPRPSVASSERWRSATRSRCWAGSEPAALEAQLVDAWALVAPSRAEPLGFVALEAIVRDVPVIASELGGFGETVQRGTSGLLFPNGDESALHDELRRVARREAFPTGPPARGGAGGGWRIGTISRVTSSACGGSSARWPSSGLAGNALVAIGHEDVGAEAREDHLPDASRAWPSWPGPPPPRCGSPARAGSRRSRC